MYFVCFIVRNNVKLTGTNKLVVPRKKTISGAKVCNSLSDELHLVTILREFSNAIGELHL